MAILDEKKLCGVSTANVPAEPLDVEAKFCHLGRANVLALRCASQCAIAYICTRYLKIIFFE
jgi:hypothetical protein